MDESEEYADDLQDASDVIALDKAQVLQEAAECLMATSEKTKKLVDVLTKCIFIMLKGDKLTNTEATDLFFHMTRLFQYKDKDNTLRRLTYIGIKALSQQAENVYVVTSSLTTDVNSSRDDPAVRASALRALCQISDASTFTTIERYLRQSVVDKHPVVASAALTSLMRIAQINGEVVRRCTNEIQAALNSDSPMVQYHALALKHVFCGSDRSAISNLINDCIDKKLNSPLATSLLIRIMTSYTIELSDEKERSEYISEIAGYLSCSSEMVSYEASNALITIACDLSKPSKSHRVTDAVSHLKALIFSSRPIVRFAALEALNRLSAIAPDLANLDTRSWVVHRIGSLCKLHLLAKRYKPNDEIIGVIEFTPNSRVICAKYCCILHCNELEQNEIRKEFSLGYKQSDFSITIPQLDYSVIQAGSALPFVLSILFHIANKNYPKGLYEDRAGIIELGPRDLETRLFSCDFPILVHT